MLCEAILEYTINLTELDRVCLACNLAVDKVKVGSSVYEAFTKSQTLQPTNLPVSRQTESVAISVNEIEQLALGCAGLESGESLMVELSCGSNYREQVTLTHKTSVVYLNGVDYLEFGDVLEVRVVKLVGSGEKNLRIINFPTILFDGKLGERINNQTFRKEVIKDLDQYIEGFDERYETKFIDLPYRDAIRDQLGKEEVTKVISDLSFRYALLIDTYPESLPDRVLRSMSYAAEKVSGWLRKAATWLSDD